MSVLELIDRARLRNAPPQVLEAYGLYRGMRYRGMVVGNAAYHAVEHHKAVIRLLRPLRTTNPGDTARLDELLAEVRAHHTEFMRIGELETPITPWEHLDDLNETRRRAKLDAEHRS